MPQPEQRRTTPKRHKSDEVISQSSWKKDSRSAAIRRVATENQASLERQSSALAALNEGHLEQLSISALHQIPTRYPPHSPRNTAKSPQAHSEVPEQFHEPVTWPSMGIGLGDELQEVEMNNINGSPPEAQDDSGGPQI